MTDRFNKSFLLSIYAPLFKKSLRTPILCSDMFFKEQYTSWQVFFRGEFTSIIFYRCKTKPSSFIWKKITSILNYIRICILFLSKSFTSNIILKICQKIKEKLSNNRDKTLRKKIIFISDEAGFHRFLYIVIDMIDILFYQYIYFYANICTITV